MYYKKGNPCMSTCMPKCKRRCVKTFTTMYRVYENCCYEMVKVCPHCGCEYDHYHYHRCPSCGASYMDEMSGSMMHGRYGMRPYGMGSYGMGEEEEY